MIPRKQWIGIIIGGSAGYLISWSIRTSHEYFGYSDWIRTSLYLFFMSICIGFLIFLHKKIRDINKSYKEELEEVMERGKV